MSVTSLLPAEAGVISISFRPTIQRGMLNTRYSAIGPKNGSESLDRLAGFETEGLLE